MRDSVEMKIKTVKESGSVEDENNFVLFMATDCTAELSGGNLATGGGGVSVPEK